jgi:hypothetical protein
MNRKLYAVNWEEISRRIRFERAKGRCESCGVRHGVIGARDLGGEWHDEADIHTMNSSEGVARFGEEFPDMIRIVLTCAHLDHDTTNNDEANLQALCQRCHNRLDMPMRQRHARETRLAKKRAALVGMGQMELF